MNDIYIYAGSLQAATAWNILRLSLASCDVFQMTRRSYECLSEEEQGHAAEFADLLKAYELKVEESDHWLLSSEYVEPFQRFSFRLNRGSFSVLERFGHPYTFRPPYFYEDLLFTDSGGNWMMGVSSTEQKIVVNSETDLIEHIKAIAPDLTWKLHALT